MTYLVITDDGKMFHFNPDDWAYIVNQKDVDEGTYDLKVETQKIEGDKVTMRITQKIPPLVKIRP